MRPSPIIWFERVILLAVALGILNVGLGWESFTARVHTPVQLFSFLIAQIIYFSVYLLLIWLIARRGSTIARWAFVVMVLTAALLFFLFGLPPPADWPLARTILTPAQCLVTLASLGLIFGPDTGPWFRGRGVPVDPEIFR